MPPGLLITLAPLSAVAPFATDLYLPAFPPMVTDLDTSATAVQLTLTAFLLGLATGQLVFGPLSNRFGRVRPLIVGAVICVLASATTVFAPTIEILIGARFVQGSAGAAGMVIGRAVIADLATGKAAARALSLMMIVAGVAPVIAPLAGGFLVGPIGWRGALAVILALSGLMLVAVWWSSGRRTPNTAEPNSARPAARSARRHDDDARPGRRRSTHDLVGAAAAGDGREHGSGVRQRHRAAIPAALVMVCAITTASVGFACARPRTPPPSRTSPDRGARLVTLKGS